MAKKYKREILIILGLILICCGAFIVESILAGRSSEEVLDKIKQSEVVAEKIDRIKATEEVEEAALVIPIDFDAAWQINEDAIAWIKIPNTTVDYPILQSPDEDNYYSDHDIEKIQHWIPGSIYINLNNSPDLSDRNTIIYGHNVHVLSGDGTGTMFGDLVKYYEEEFFQKNKEIIIYTPQNKLSYEIFAAVTYNNKSIPDLYDLDTREGHQDFLQSIYNTNMKTDLYSDKEVGGR
ncbi:MAG TPA: class B sortase [Clostridia bacterium]|nr:class B sortase [Clostridia bacterium]